MILSMQVMETMVDNIEFVRELIKIIKNCFHPTVDSDKSKKTKIQLINYNTCEGKIQIKIDPNKKESYVFFINEYKKEGV